MAYYHCTNLQSPFDAVDQKFLDTLANYVIGDPIPAKPDPNGIIRSRSFDELTALGIVGVYTTIEAIMTPAAQQLVGWGPGVLGAQYQAPDIGVALGERAISEASVNEQIEPQQSARAESWP